MNTDKIREDFVVLRQRSKGKPIVYMDNACMSFKPRQVVDAMNRYYNEFPACALRSHHKLAKQATEEYTKAREQVAKFIGAKTNECIFTRNTTEGINLVSHSFGLGKGDVVITTDKEHNSNLVPWLVLSQRGIRHEIVKSNDDGSFNMENLQAMLDKHGSGIKLASFVHTSNLDGSTMPIEEMIKVVHDAGALVMVDAAQSIPHKQIDVRKMDADFLAFSGHKMLGPTGTGILYGKYHLLEKLQPFITGGDTVVKTTYTSVDFEKPPERFEAGLQNYAGMLGLAAACKYLDGIGMDNIEKHEAELNKIITDGIKNIQGLKILGPADATLRSGIVSFVVDKMHVHDIAIMLDEMENIMIRSGQHCVHSWFAARGIEGSARASLYLYNTAEEARLFVETLKKIAMLR